MTSEAIGVARLFARFNDAMRRSLWQQRRRATHVWAAVALMWPAWLAAAHPPSIIDLEPRGLQIGDTTRVVLKGTGLNDVLQWVSPLCQSIHVQTVSASSDELQLDVRLDGAAEAGIYPLRVATEAGLSNAIAIGVDRLPQEAFHDSIHSLPVALHGRLAGSQVLATEFTGQAGQHIVVDVESRRLGSKLRPTLRVYSPSNRIVSIARPSLQLGGDARLHLVLPESGRYRLELQDIVYDAGDANWFRLKLGDLKYADVAFPLVVGRTTEAVELVSSNVETLAVLRPAALGGQLQHSVPWPDSPDALFTGAAPRVRLSPWGASEWLEDDARQEGIRLRVPLGINGRLSEPGEQDEYDIEVEPGQKLTLEVHADRLGSPLDAMLAVTSPDGQVLAQADDQPGSTDPRLDVDVPAELSRLRIRVSSRAGRGDKSAVYWLSVGPRQREAPLLETELESLNLPAGDTVIVPFRIDHRGAPRAMQLAVTPALEYVVDIFPRQLDATDELGLISFTAAPTARGVFRGGLQIVCDDGSTEAPASLQMGRFPGTSYQPQWRQEMMIAVTPPSELRLAWSDAGREYLARGTRRPLEVQLTRRNAAAGKVRLSLISSQPPPRKQVNGQSEPDPDRALRLADAVVIAPDADRATASLLIPADLPLHAWSWALKGELLGNDENSILAVAYTPLRRWETIAPLRISWDVAGPISVQLGDSSSVVLRGRIQRHPDFDVPVVVQAQGLDAGESSPITLAPGEDDFEITLQFAKEARPREVSEFQLLAAPAEPTDANRGIRSLTDPVALKVVAADST